MPLQQAERVRGPASAATANRVAGAGAADRSARGQVLQLQAAAGNAAVAAMLGGEPTRHPVQRLVRGVIAGPPVPPSPPDPSRHPGFVHAKRSAKAASVKMTRHPSVAAKVAAAAKAAEPPAGDKDAQAKAVKAGEMVAAPAGGFDKAAFIASVKAAIDKQSPKTLEDADEFGRSGRSDAIAADVRGQVAHGKDGASKPMAEASAKAPDQSKAVEKPVEPIPPEAATASPRIDAGQAAPARAPPEQLDLAHGPAQTQQQMADAGVTDEQLRNSNEPEFAGALAAKQDAEHHAATAPAAVRAQETQVLAGARQDAGAQGAQASIGMLGARTGGQAGVAAKQQQQRSKDEQERAAVTANVTRMFDETKTAVDAILTGIDPLVDAAFKAGEGNAKQAFTDQHTREMREFKDRRYSGVGGGLRWTADLLLGPEPEVDAIFRRARATYEREMTTTINAVADVVGRELTRAKERVAEGRTKIDTYVRGLSPALRKVGSDAAKEVGGRFDELEQSVDEKGTALAEDLAAKYVEARTAVDDEITKMQEEHKGLVDKAKDAVGGAVQTILKLKDMLLGVLARAAGAVEKIIKDPMQFLSNFVGAVKAGVQGFLSNIGEHLKKGLQGWLFGALGEAGIELPEKFDLKGIIKLVLSLLGLTWANLRARIVRQVPEPVMEKLEKTAEVLQILLSEGVGGLWKFIAAKLADLKETVMGKVREFVQSKIITAGITWLISLLNPAAAFVKACKMIYDAVMWFVDNAERMKDFVDSVLESVESIASGGVGRVAGLIESTMARTVPMIISGLASLLGLGGIGEKVKGIIESIQKPINKVVDSIIGGVIKAAGPLIRAFKRGAGWAKGKVEAGKAWVKGKARQIGEALGIIRKPFAAAGEQHTLSFDARNGKFILASTPTPLEVALKRMIGGRDTAALRARVAEIIAAATRVAGIVARSEPDKAKAAALVAELVPTIAGLIADSKEVGPVGKDASTELQSAKIVGNIAPHSSQPAPRPHLWSEHVVPDGYISAVLLAHGGSETSENEYNRMPTVLLWLGARQQKDFKRLQPGEISGDLTLSKSVKGRAKSGRGAGASGASMARAYSLLATGAIKRTIAAVERDHATNGASRKARGVIDQMKPDANTIRQAAAAQLAVAEQIFAKHGHDASFMDSAEWWRK
ncbi:phage tail protein [Agromyces sp. Marseille-Q5079]|uniref:phage tail protein n=1 Tax=Agromyces sp. Marseille-Q5079 TaxID=3439059 RepID=UPI003D9C9E24